MLKNTDTAIIILNWNGWQHTIKCINSILLVLKPQNIKLLVCDNGSTDDSWIQLQHYITTKNYKNQPRIPIKLLQTGKNLGFAAGMNIGIRQALLDTKIQYVWLLNNDTWLQHDALSPLKTCARSQPQVGLWGSYIYNSDKQLQSAGGYRYNAWLTHISALKKNQTNADYMDGAALFIPRYYLETVGLLSEDYFLFYEELDYSERLRKAGYHIACCEKSKVYHQGSASLGGSTLEKRWQRQYYETRNTLLFSAKYYPQRLWFIIPWRFSIKLLLLLWRGETDVYSAIFKAYRDYFKC